MGKPSDQSKKLVESMIDSLVKGEVNVNQAVDKMLGSSSKSKDKEDTVTFGESEDIVCPDCGSTDFEEGFVESAEGEQIPALRCKACDCGLVLETEADSKDEDGLEEAEIDDENPACPKCGSTDLDHDIVESDGEEHIVITCGQCKTRMVVAD